MPSRYLPVSRPEASGLQIVVPIADVVVQACVLLLDALALQQVVLRAAP